MCRWMTTIKHIRTPPTKKIFKKIKNLGLKIQKTKGREGGVKRKKNLAKVPPGLKGLLVKC